MTSARSDSSLTSDLHLVTVSGAPVPLRSPQLIVAGYTGRDEAAVRRHIDELALIGVPEPLHVPMFYCLPPDLLTTAESVRVEGEQTSGEVEPVFIRSSRAWFLGVGSDHTDRLVERRDVGSSKAACPKPVGRVVLPLPDHLGAVEWDDVTIASTVDGEPYQRGSLASLRTPQDVFEHMTEALGHIEGDVVVFGGTVPLMADGFMYGRVWDVALTVPNAGTLTHHYEVDRMTR